MKYKKTTKF